MTEGSSSVIFRGIGWWFNWWEDSCKELDCKPGCHPRLHGFQSTEYAESHKPLIREYVHEPWIIVNGNFERGFVAKALFELDELHGLNNIGYWHDQGCGQHQNIEGHYPPYRAFCNYSSCIDWDFKQK